jgi:MOSC domain-containing protein YiiM
MKMANGKVLTLYMTMPDMMRSGYRQTVDNFECNQGGIVGDKNYEIEGKNMILLVSKSSYELIRIEDLYIEQGLLMENIYTDLEINHLKEGSVVEIGDVLFKVTGHCHAYRYLYAFAPNLPEVLENKRGIFIEPLEHGTIYVDDEVSILEEA